MPPANPPTHSPTPSNLTGSSSPALSDEKKLDDLEFTAVTTNTLSAGVPGVDEPSTEEDEGETKRIMRKMDWHLLPILSVLYLFSFLDRTSIGNAKVAGMNATLGLTSTEYALALSLFFIPYGALEVPSNLVMKKLGAKVWLPIMVVMWGIVMTLTGVVHNATGLIISRLFLGGTEAGLFPGISLLLSFLYPSRYIQLRIGLFFSAATIAGAFGGLLAYGLSFAKAPGAWYNESWRWIFVVEGLATILVGIISYRFLISTYDDAKWMTPHERVYMTDRLRFDRTKVPMDDTFRWKYVRAGLADWKTWVSLVTYISTLAALYSVALTLPVILKTTLGYSAVNAQLLSVPVYIVAAVCVVIFALAADRMHNRTLFICLGTGISAIGWILSYSVNNARVRYFAMFLGALGSYAGFPSIVALVSQNTGGKTKRAVCLAIQVGVGGLSGIISSNIFLDREAPYYPTAHKINIALNCTAIVSALFNAFLLKRANQRKQRIIDSGEAAKFSSQEIAEMGDESPYFMYKI